MSKKLRNVFISHVHEDDPKVSDLKDLLSRNDCEVRDYSITKDNPNNAHNEEYIKREILAPRIRAAGVLLVIITPETKDSDYVDWEIEYAEKLGKRIIGVWGWGSKDCDIPDALEDLSASLVGWDQEKIIAALNGADYQDGPNNEERPYIPMKPADC